MPMPMTTAAHARRARLLVLGLGAVCGLLPAHAAYATGWGWNVGYHNPAGATVGLNLQYLGASWAFETGIGWLDVRQDKQPSGGSSSSNNSSSNDGKTTTSVTASGDVDVKYFLTGGGGGGGVRVYLQGGVGVGLGAGSGGAGIGTGGGFGGLGLLFGGSKVYAYAAYDLDSARDGFVQAGIGTTF